MRKLGIDYGDSRIGFAVSDPMGIIASALETYNRRNLDLDIDYISNIVKAKEVDAIIIGLPINMDGTSGGRVDKTKEFADKLKTKINLPIIFLDERMTSMQAQRSIDMMGVKKSKQKSIIDGLAAQIILQAYLDSAKR